MPTKYSKEDDYTLIATNLLPAGGSITRIFNFASEQVTTIYREKAELSGEARAYSSEGGVSVASSVALSAQMQIQKFSELDSPVEVDLLREKLKKEGGNPPDGCATLDKQKHPAAVAKLG